MTKIDDEYLKSKRALAYAASPGPWTTQSIWLGGELYVATQVIDDDGEQCADCYDNTRRSDEKNEANAAFCADARTTVVELLDEVERLTAFAESVVVEHGQLQIEIDELKNKIAWHEAAELEVSRLKMTEQECARLRDQLPCSTCGASDWQVHHCADCRIKMVGEANSVERYKLTIACDRLREERDMARIECARLQDARATTEPAGSAQVDLPIYAERAGADIERPNGPPLALVKLPRNCAVAGDMSGYQELVEMVRYLLDPRSYPSDDRLADIRERLEELDAS